MDYKEKNGNIQLLAVCAALKLWLYNNTEWQSARFGSFLLHILKQYHLRRAIKRPTLSILFPSLLQIFPPLNSQDKLSLCQEKASYHFFLQNHTNHRLGHSSWQPITKLQLTSLATEQTIWWTTKREGCRLSQGSWRGYKLYQDAPEGLPKQLRMIYWDGR